jgi:hypothetical protein
MKQILLIYLFIICSLYSSGQNIGIGISVPTEKLQVAGNIKSTATIKANDIQFNSPKTYYYSVSGADFVAKNSNDEIHREGITTGGAYFLTSTEGMVASVHLPHGATVTKMTAFFEDQGLAVDLQVRLRQNSGLFILASVTSSGSSGEASLFDATISNAVINNSTTAYVIDALPIGGAWPGLNIIIHKVIIEYQLSQL